MDAARVIRRLLRRHPHAMRRRLTISTFHVTPLTEHSGILEWVPNTQPLRTLITDAYMQANLFDPRKTLVRIKSLHEKCAKAQLHEWLRNVMAELPP